MSNNHSTKLLEDCLEAAYRDRIKRVLEQTLDHYIVPAPGETPDDSVRRMHLGLQKLYEAHTLMAKELKNDT